jgi:CRP-like cAMP-binding protein
VPDDVLARVFGAVQGLWVATIGVGAIVAPLLIAAVDIRGALLITGALLPILAVLLRSRLTQLDDVPVPERELALLRGIDLFHPLPAPTLESLARALVPLRVQAGEEVFRQGDLGDRYYIVAEGEVEIVADGRVVAVTGPGGYFGEIALIRDVPRTATVRAKTDVELMALDRDDFIAAVTGHAASAEAADSVIAARLASLRPGLASV